MKRFEYLRKQIPKKDEERVLNNLGALRWELIQIVIMPHGREYFFKKEIKDGEA